ncbi:MAG: hypothetical protein ACK59M_08180 [Pseudomonadota bacterium]|jgi:hypothetical protein
MNVTPIEPALPESLRRRLAALPDFVPPAGLRERVAAQTWDAPRAARWPRAAVAAALGALLLAGLWGQGERTPDTTVLVARMALLEREVANLRAAAAPGAATTAMLEGELSRIDRALQAAYVAGAPPATLHGLWRDREAALQQLLLAYQHPDRMIRI